MYNIREAVKNRGKTIQEVERSELFLDRQRWRALFADRP